MENKNCIVLNMLTITIGLIFSLTFSPAFALTSNGSDTDSLETYIVYVRKPDQDQATTSIKLDLDSWYHSFLPVSISSSINNQPRMLYCYKNVITGFAARLTAEQAKAMETKEGFISAHVEKTLQLHTTHTPNFLGLHQNSGFWKDSNLGKGVIIGVMDTGITPGHPSFSDEGMPPPPAKWKGKCEFKGAACNNKLIGARNFLQGSTGEPPLDDEGHGTHTATTAAGNFVNGANVFGQANGTAVGIAPLAHLAIYKVCDFDGCSESRVYAAMDTAIDDGVDVLSLSLGAASVPFFEDPLAIGSFSAIQKEIFVSCSAGNEGPNPSTSSNEAPWILSVGASTTDRSIVASVELGNQAVYDGEALFQPKDFPSKQFPLIYPGVNGNVSSAQCSPGSLSSDIRGKLVLCERGGGERTKKGQVVKDAGGIGMILMNDKLNGYSTLADPHLLPAVHVSYAAGESIKAYINSTSSPNATIVFKGTVIGKKSTPEVASFSSRGPSIASPGILKPDIIGPGVNILAAWPFSVENKTNTKSTFNMVSGTSMSCPHLSGVAALLKSAHPDWSPAAIKSAIMTTADIVSLDGKPIVDQRLLPADLFAVGAGHVNPSSANDPGLIYDIQPDDYIPYLCGLNYSDQHVQDIVMINVQCSKVSGIAETELNYPSFSVILGSTSQTYNRTVTNVGQAESSYTHKIVAPEGVTVTVEPENISFTKKNQKAIYSITFTRSQKTSALFAQGYLSWVSTKHTVRSPIAVRFQ